MHNEEMFKRTVQPVLDVHQKPKPGQWAFLSLQHLFAMFGATVLVPFLTGLPVKEVPRDPQDMVMYMNIDFVYQMRCTSREVTAQKAHKLTISTHVLVRA